MIRSLLAACAFSALSLPASAAPPADVADVFPAGTLAYAELHNPAELGPQLAAVFKGTPLEDSVAFIENKRSTSKTLPEADTRSGIWPNWRLFVSPEECSRSSANSAGSRSG